jgi:hypothetical protein
MSTLKTTNLQHASAASPAIVLAADGSATAQVSSLNGGPLSGTRNRIINGDMRIDQRNGGASVTITSTAADTYTLDRWAAFGSVASKFSVQQNAGSVTPPAGFTSYLGATSLSAYTPGAAESFILYQRIEGYNAADLGFGLPSAQSVTISFWVRSSLTGTFGGSLRNESAARSYPFSYTISAANTWEQKTVTISGDTTGTWNKTNGRGIELFFSLGCGSSNSGTAGSWAAASFFSATGATSVVGTNGATFYITGVQLEAGTVATPFERRSYGQELALCQRYAYAWGNNGAQFAAVGGNGLYGDANTLTMLLIDLNASVMRTVPTTITTVGTQGTDWAVQSSAGANQTGFTLTTGVGVLTATKTSHGLGTSANLRVLTSSGRIIVSSEL